jgi:hypothetical protein
MVGLAPSATAADPHGLPPSDGHDEGPEAEYAHRTRPHVAPGRSDESCGPSWVANFCHAKDPLRSRPGSCRGHRGYGIE